VRRRRVRGQRGQVVPLVAVIVVVAAGAALVLARLGTEVIDRARARTAADAAALAGVRGDRVAAERVARADGGALERYVRVGDQVEVTVRVGGFRATARASIGDPGHVGASREPKWPPAWGHATVHALRYGAIAQSVRAHP
jgi:hypothetical protein